MKKIIGIYFPYWDYAYDKYWDSDYAKKYAIGGSQRWVVDTASEFQRRGFKVIVFGNPEYHYFDDDGVEYETVNNFELRCEYQHFDYFIFCRSPYYVPKWLDCQNIYIYCPDAFLYEIENINDLKLNKIKKLACLSEWQEKNFKALYGDIDDNHILRISNPNINTLYKDVDIDNKENAMLWSSRPERGLKWFIDNIFSKIKEEVPDFKLKICSYSDCKYDYGNIDGVEVLGYLNRERLAEVQKKCKLWAYPNFGIDDDGCLFHETFCNTAVENALAGNAIVCWKIGALATTLDGMENFLPSDNYILIGEGYYPCFAYESRVDNFLNECIKILEDDNYFKKLSKKNIEIGNRYTPKKCCDVWINEFGLNYMI